MKIRTSTISPIIRKLTPIIESKTILKEGLIKSVNPIQAGNLLDRLGYDVEFQGDVFTREKYVELYKIPITTSLFVNFDQLPVYEEFQDNFLRIINLLGYYISMIHARGYDFSTSNIHSIIQNKQAYLKFKRQVDLMSTRVEILIEAKYDVEIPKKELTGKLYHVTLQSSLEKIKKIGLSPKSHEKKTLHPDRIYLATDINTAKNLWDMFRVINYNYNDAAILEIDPKYIPNFKCYLDPNAPNAVYTYNNIPPKYIEVMTDK